MDGESEAPPRYRMEAIDWALAGDGLTKALSGREVRAG